jgi:hypothetical protein
LEKARTGKYQVLFEMTEPGAVYVDGVMLGKGRELSEFSFPDALEVGLGFAEPSMLFEAGEPVTALVKMANRTDEEQPLTVAYRVTGFDDAEVASGEREVRAVPGLSEVVLELPLREKGYYRFTLRVSNGRGDIVSEQTASLAIIRKSRSPGNRPDSPFGVSLSPNRLELELERAKAIGVEHVRVHEDFTWKNVEGDRGVYRWDQASTASLSGEVPSGFYKPAVYDYGVYADSGLNPLIYVQGYDKDFPAWAEGESREERLREYGDFFKALTAHYRGTFNDFEVVGTHGCG